MSALIDNLSKSMKVVKGKAKRAEKIKIANNLFELGVAINVIVRATGLSAREFT